MKVLLFGYGSIGKRHAANLRALMPDVELGIYDPLLGLTTDMRPDAAIIASPTAMHAAHVGAMGVWGVPFYVEKPLGTTHFSHIVSNCAVGFQYRFHPAMQKIKLAARKYQYLDFRARDDLLGRYGADVDGVMAAHPIDTALWLLGSTRYVELASDGLHLSGRIEHERGYSRHDYLINRGPRVSTVEAGETYELPPDDGMYRDALAAWLAWVDGGPRDERTATLADGLAVERVLAQVKHG